jgi:hypothetical protein
VFTKIRGTYIVTMTVLTAISLLSGAVLVWLLAIIVNEMGYVPRDLMTTTQLYVSVYFVSILLAIVKIVCFTKFSRQVKRNICLWLLSIAAAVAVPIMICFTRIGTL